jgi:hypothetical protein
MIKTFLKEYLERNKASIEADKLLLSRCAIFSIRAEDAIFDCTSIILEEIKDFCAKQGFDIDKVVIVSSYDTDLNLETPVIKSDSNTIIRVVERENGKIEAVVFFGGYTETKG